MSCHADWVREAQSVPPPLLIGSRWHVRLKPEYARQKYQSPFDGTVAEWTDLRMFVRFEESKHWLYCRFLDLLPCSTNDAAMKPTPPSGSCEHGT